MSAVLRANLALNDCANVRIVEAGLGPEDAELPFSFHEDGNDGSGTFAKGTGDRTLPVRHGDSLIAELGLDRNAISFVKCDVEGFEHSVFQGSGLCGGGGSMAFPAPVRKHGEGDVGQESACALRAPNPGGSA